MLHGKNCMESKGLRANLAKTKVMISDISQGPTFTSGKHSYEVFCKDISFNSIFCSDSAHWMHRWCSRLSSSLGNVVNFKCRTCLNPFVTHDEDIKVVHDNVDYEVVDQSCYLGNMVSVGGMAKASTMPMPCVRSGWKKIRELLPLLTSTVFSHKMKGELQLVLEVLCYMVARSGLRRKVVSALFLKLILGDLEKNNQENSCYNHLQNI